MEFSSNQDICTHRLSGDIDLLPVEKCCHMEQWRWRSRAVQRQ